MTQGPSIGCILTGYGPCLAPILRLTLCFAGNNFLLCWQHFLLKISSKSSHFHSSHSFQLSSSLLVIQITQIVSNRLYTSYPPCLPLLQSPLLTNHSVKCPIVPNAPSALALATWSSIASLKIRFLPQPLLYLNHPQKRHTLHHQHHLLPSLLLWRLNLTCLGMQTLVPQLT